MRAKVAERFELHQTTLCSPPQNARRPHPARSLVQPFENMTATLIPIDGGYKRRVNRPAASAVAKASGEGSFLRAKEGGVREGGGRAGRIGCKPLHLLALPGARASGRFISLPLRQLPLNMLKESLVDVPAMQMSECWQKAALQPCG
jgi:hypothetical protein